MGCAWWYSKVPIDMVATKAVTWGPELAQAEANYPVNMDVSNRTHNRSCNMSSNSRNRKNTRSSL